MRSSLDARLSHGPLVQCVSSGLALSTAADARRLARVTLAHAGATTLATLVAPLPAKLPPSAEEKLGSWPSEEIEKASVMVAVSQTMHQLKRCRIGGTGLQGTP